jgi:hypothetical protein
MARNDIYQPAEMSYALARGKGNFRSPGLYRDARSRNFDCAEFLDMLDLS